MPDPERVSFIALPGLRPAALAVVLKTWSHFAKKGELPRAGELWLISTRGADEARRRLAVELYDPPLAGTDIRLASGSVANVSAEVQGIAKDFAEHCRRPEGGGSIPVFLADSGPNALVARLAHTLGDDLIYAHADETHLHIRLCRDSWWTKPLQDVGLDSLLRLAGLSGVCVAQPDGARNNQSGRVHGVAVPQDFAESGGRVDVQLLRANKPLAPPFRALYERRGRLHGLVESWVELSADEQRPAADAEDDDLYAARVYRGTKEEIDKHRVRNQERDDRGRRLLEKIDQWRRAAIDLRPVLVSNWPHTRRLFREAFIPTANPTRPGGRRLIEEWLARNPLPPGRSDEALVAATTNEAEALPAVRQRAECAAPRLEGPIQSGEEKEAQPPDLCVALGTNVASTLTAILSHKPRVAHVFYDASTPEVSLRAQRLAHFWSGQSETKLCFHPTDLHGRSIEQDVAAIVARLAGKPRDLHINVSPGSKAQACAFARAARASSSSTGAEEPTPRVVLWSLYSRGKKCVAVLDGGIASIPFARPDLSLFAKIAGGELVADKPRTTPKSTSPGHQFEERVAAAMNANGAFVEVFWEMVFRGRSEPKVPGPSADGGPEPLEACPAESACDEASNWKLGEIDIAARYQDGQGAEHILAIECKSGRRWQPDWPRRVQFAARVNLGPFAIPVLVVNDDVWNQDHLYVGMHGEVLCLPESHLSLGNELLLRFDLDEFIKRLQTMGATLHSDD